MSRSIILGTGQSLYKYEYQYGDFVIGLNDIIQYYDKLDAICFADRWPRVKKSRPSIQNTPLQVKKFTPFEGCELPNTEVVKTRQHTFNGKFSIDRQPISHGSSSALYAICIACLWGYKRIEAYGVDMITHQGFGAHFQKRKIDILKVPTWKESGIKEIKKYGCKYSLHNSIIELILLRQFLASKKIDMRLTKYSPIARIVNED